MTNDENESANIKASNPLTPQQDNRIFESIPVRPAPWSKQSEAEAQMNRERALGMFRTANQWLYERISEGATCDCGNCYLCAYNFFALAPASPVALRDEAEPIAVKWAETLSEGEQSILLTSSLRRLRGMITAIIERCLAGGEERRVSELKGENQ